MKGRPSGLRIVQRLEAGRASLAMVNDTSHGVSHLSAR